MLPDYWHVLSVLDTIIDEGFIFIRRLNDRWTILFVSNGPKACTQGPIAHIDGHSLNGGAVITQSYSYWLNKHGIHDYVTIQIFLLPNK